MFEYLNTRDGKFKIKELNKSQSESQIVVESKSIIKTELEGESEESIRKLSWKRKHQQSISIRSGKNKQCFNLKSVQFILLLIIQVSSLLNPTFKSSIVFINGETRRIPSGATCLLPTIKNKLSIVESSLIDIEEHFDPSTSPEFAAIKLVKPFSSSFYDELIQYSQNTLLYRNQFDTFSNKQQQSSQKRLRKRQYITYNQTILASDSEQRNVVAIPAKHQIAFESICNGWRNSIEPNSLKPPAFWAFDGHRGALVAKFIYYDQQEFLDISLREARLTSPIFHPIPAYHSMQDSKYYSSCKVSFKAYITMTAYLELTLIIVPTTTSGGQVNKHYEHQQSGNETTIRTSTKIKTSDNVQISKPKQHQQQQPRPIQQSYQLAKLVGGKTPIGIQMAKKAGELAAWTYHEIELPHNLGENSLYVLEFSAMSGTVSSAALQQHSFLNGVAIANFSLSPQCFGFNVDEGELKRLKSITGKDPREFDEDLLSKINSQGFQQTNGVDHKSIINFLETYKMAILIIVILILVILIASSQCLLCVYHQSQLKRSNNNSNSNINNNNNNKKKKKEKTILPLSIVESLCCCCCYVCCYDTYRRHTNRHRVYASKQSDAQDDKLREEERNLRNYLRPIQNVFENVELNENPNYVANGATCLSKEVIAQLKPYFIERKRLTQTNKLGSGAFGDVYQGFLLCYSSDTHTDNNNIINNRFHQNIEFDHCDSHSKKVAVKTLTEKRMSAADFITEAINMSLVTPHRNIVELIGVCFDEQPLYIVMELLEGGNLKDFLIANRDKSSIMSQSQYPSHNQIHSIDVSPFKHYNDDFDSYNYGNDDYLQSNPINDGTNLLWKSNLQQHQNENCVKLCMGDLLVFALDIARACDYLQKKRFIHRDLAARNCLLTSSMKRIKNDCSEQQLYVQENSMAQQQQPHHLSNQNQRNSSVSGKSFVGYLPSALEVNADYKVDLEQVFLDGYMNSGMVAKLADFGMTRDVKQKEYYSVKHKEMPVRWMPPEYVVDGVATTKSDVWSFGVFLWELFSMGQQPYQELADNQDVIKFIKSRRFAEPKMMTHSQSKTETELVTILDESNPTIVLHKNINSLNEDQNNNLECNNENHINNINDQVSEDESDAFYTKHKHQSMPTNEFDAPLPPPHHNTPHPVYSIMCSCWATEPKKRPDFEEIANRLYWCLQKVEVLETNLPVFYESHSNTSPSSNIASGQQNIRSESRQSGANNTQTTQLNWP